MVTVLIFQSNSETIGRSKALVLILFEPAHDKTYNKTCPTSEDSDHPAHLRSMIRVVADRMCIPQPQTIQRGINDNPGRTEWMNRLICVAAGCRFCRALAHL